MYDVKAVTAAAEKVNKAQERLAKAIDAYNVAQKEADEARGDLSRVQAEFNALVTQS